MKNNFSILKTLPLTFFLLIFFISALVLYQLKNEPKKVQSIKSQLIGKNIPKILIPEVKYFGSLNQKQKVRTYLFYLEMLTKIQILELK